jgi:hypothetical protein
MSLKIVKAAEREAQKKVAPKEEVCATIRLEDLRAYLLGTRHALLIQLSALDKVLNLSRKCTGCGNDL